MLTDAKVRNAKPESMRLKRSDERGLYLEVSPKGGKRRRPMLLPVDPDYETLRNEVLAPDFLLRESWEKGRVRRAPMRG